MSKAACLASAIEEVLTGRTPDEQDRKLAYAPARKKADDAPSHQFDYLYGLPTETNQNPHNKEGQFELPVLPPDLAAELDRLILDRRHGRVRHKGGPRWRFVTKEDERDWLQHFFATAFFEQVKDWKALSPYGKKNKKQWFFACVSLADKEYLQERESFERGAGIPRRASTYNPLSDSEQAERKARKRTIAKGKQPVPAPYLTLSTAGRTPPYREYRDKAGANPPDPTRRPASTAVRPLPMLTGPGSHPGELITDPAYRNVLEDVIDREADGRRWRRRDRLQHKLYRRLDRNNLARLEADIAGYQQSPEGREAAQRRAEHRDNASNAARRRSGAAKTWPDAMPDPRPAISRDMPAEELAALRDLNRQPYTVSLTHARRSQTRCPQRVCAELASWRKTWDRLKSLRLAHISVKAPRGRADSGTARTVGTYWRP